MSANIEISLFDLVQLTDFPEDRHGKTANAAKETEAVSVVEPYADAEHFVDRVIRIRDEESYFFVILEILCRKLIKNVLDGVPHLIGWEDFIGQPAVITNSTDNVDVTPGFLLQIRNAIREQVAGERDRFRCGQLVLLKILFPQDAVDDIAKHGEDHGVYDHVSPRFENELCRIGEKLFDTCNGDIKGIFIFFHSLRMP